MEDFECHICKKETMHIEYEKHKFLCVVCDTITETLYCNECSTGGGAVYHLPPICE